MTGMHDAVFQWPGTDASSVILTGTFDKWSKSISLTRMASGFETTLKIPWGEKVAYKFIVDGRWVIKDGHPVEIDPLGNWNNVYTAPTQPPPSPDAILSATLPPLVQSSNSPDAETPEKIQVPVVPLTAATTTIPTTTDTTSCPPEPAITSTIPKAPDELSTHIPLQVVRPTTRQATDPVLSDDSAPTTTEILTEPTLTEAATARASAPITPQEVPDKNAQTVSGSEQPAPPIPALPKPEQNPSWNGNDRPQPASLTNCSSPVSSSPSKPAKSPKYSFPSFESPVGSSPTSHKFGIPSPRKKRESLLVKIKHIFTHDKEGEKEKR